MALAGPGTNLALALIAGLLIRVGYEWQVFSAPHAIGAARLAVGSGGTDILAQILSIFLSLNLLLCAFNLVPLAAARRSSAPLLLLPPAAAENIQRLRSPLLRYAGILLASRLIPPTPAEIADRGRQLAVPAMNYLSMKLLPPCVVSRCCSWPAAFSPPAGGPAAPDHAAQLAAAASSWMRCITKRAPSACTTAWPRWSCPRATSTSTPRTRRPCWSRSGATPRAAARWA